MDETDDLRLLENQLADERKRVDVANHNFSARELMRMLADDELNIAPAYQRKFRWTKSGESVFIESMFLGLPVPPLFVATNIDFHWEIVDGLQRISTLTHFMASDKTELQRIGRTESLRLEGLEKLTQLNGKTYADLPKNLQIYFARQPLQVVSLTDKSDLQVRFDLFERLNKGAVSLSPQEVRACVYRGKFNDFIEDLSTDDTFTHLLKLQEKNKHDGTKAEQVLKFFAYKNFREKFDGRVEKFLNRFIEESAHNFDYEMERTLFRDTVAKLHAITNEQPFLTPVHSITPLVQFEACMVALGELLSENRPLRIPPPQNWAEDHELRDASSGGTNTRSMLRRRITRAKDLFRADSDENA
ncbi:DUF262 domain-containing protein [Nocardia wallacei]|uniref:DUF262 domain-containing protein n=1 Tax=Nocardia wallacei TaxID=480035 RepID=UPI0024578C61|nr:DUF262 domain-containing protein [Nocardia wallacei]